MVTCRCQNWRTTIHSTSNDCPDGLSTSLLIASYLTTNQMFSSFFSRSREALIHRETRQFSSIQSVARQLLAPGVLGPAVDQSSEVICCTAVVLHGPIILSVMFQMMKECTPIAIRDQDFQLFTFSNPTNGNSTTYAHLGNIIRACM